MDRVEQSQTVSLQVIRNAVAAIENDFKQHAISSRDTPILAKIGSCCLVGFIWRRTIYVANVGDSRAVIASNRAGTLIEQMFCQDHSLQNPNIRNQFLAQDHNASKLLVANDGVWRIKGRIKVSRSIGDLYLKDRNYKLPKIFRGIWRPSRRAVLTADPAVNSEALNPNHRFLIFASHGLWEHLSQDEAVGIVNDHAHFGIARRLIHKALRRAARTHNTKFAELKNMEAGMRSDIHDDMTVMVIFIDDSKLNEDEEQIAQRMPAAGQSIVGRSDEIGASKIDILSMLP